jgi:hypothetical protein
MQWPSRLNLQTLMQGLGTLGMMSSLEFRAAVPIWLGFVVQ